MVDDLLSVDLLLSWLCRSRNMVDTVKTLHPLARVTFILSDGRRREPKSSCSIPNFENGTGRLILGHVYHIRLFQTSVMMPVVGMVAIPCAAVFALNAEFLLLVSTISGQLQIRFYGHIPKLIARDTFK